MNVLIVGYGRVGKEIVKNLKNLKIINKLFILDKSVNVESRKNKLNFIKRIDNLRVDYVIISLSTMPKKAWEKYIHNEKNMFSLIQRELKYNLPEIRILSKELKKLPIKTKIIVLTNPADKITNYLIKELKQKVIGFGGELDALRFKKYLNKPVFCIGLHNQCIPLIDFKSKKEIVQVNRGISDNMIKQLKKVKMTHKITGIMFRDFFIKLNSNKESIVHMCYSKDNKLAITRPFYVKKGNILGSVPLKMNKLEKETLNEIISNNLS